MQTRDITPTTNTTSLADVEKSTKAFADARGVLTGLVQELNEIIEQTKRERLPAIKRALAKTAERQAEL
jgi:hypothetical protein